MIIVKLGGSVITEKSKIETFKQETMDNLSAQIKKSGEKIILIHGAGSFGHILAKKYKLNEGFHSENQMIGFAETQEKVQVLNKLVLKSLNNHKIIAVSISPHDFLELNNHKLDSIDYSFFEKCLDNDLVPVSFGDVVLDKKLKFSICSGDLLILALAKHFKPEKVVFAVDEDGLYDKNPKINKDAEFIDKASFKDLEKFSAKLDSHADVTGGMKGKIDAIKNISKLGIDVILVNGNKDECLYKSLVGEEVKKTIVFGEKIR